MTGKGWGGMATIAEVEVVMEVVELGFGKVE